MTRGYRSDAWVKLRGQTPARVALGRAGTSLPTGEVLKFAMDHAEARDAVHAKLDGDRLASELAAFGRPVIRVSSAAKDSAEYLLRPDSGRVLSAKSAVKLAGADEGCDVVLVLADGLSATAANQHGISLTAELLLQFSKLNVGPLILAERARVALQDPIGQRLNARCAVILLGERPGLGSADSLGGYLVFDPKPGRSDAERNCVSNIRPAGCPIPVAAATISYLVNAALARQLSGVNLKDDRKPLLTKP